MPQFIVAAGAAIFTAVKGALAAQTIWGAIARAVAMTAVQIGINKVFGSRPDTGQSSVPDTALPTSLRFQTDHPIEILFGQFATPGSAVTPPLYYGDNNEYLDRVILLNDFRSESVVAVYGDEGEALTFAGDLTSGYRACTSHYQDEDGGDCLWVRIYLGDPDQTADLDLVSRHDSITTNFRLRGRTYAIVRMKADPKAFPSGEAQLRFECQWSPAHDPRDGSSDPDDPASWPWTDNNALIAAQYKAGYFLNGKLIGGMGWARSRLPDSDLIAAANECDELVALNAGDTEKRYRCGGSFLCGRKGRNHGQNLQPVLDAMDGDLDDGGGRAARFLPGVERAVVPFKIRWQDMAREDLNYEPDLEPSDKINRITGGFSDPALLYEINDNLVRENATYLAEDKGQEFNADITLIAVTSGTQAQRILKRRMEAARAEERLAFSLPLFPYCQLERGDRVELDDEFISRLRLPDTPWRVDSRPAITPDKRLVVALRRHPDSVGDWDETTDETDIYSISRASPNLPALALSDVSVTSGGVSSGVVALPVIKMTWTPVSRAINVLVTITRLNGDGGDPVDPPEQDSRLFTGDTGEGYVMALPDGWYRVTYVLSSLGRVAPAAIADSSIQCTGTLTPTSVGGVPAAEIAAMASDGLLAPAEKTLIVPAIEALLAEQGALTTRASLYSVTATAYTSAMSTLSTYLGTLTSPVAWNVLSGNTTITATDWVANIQAAREARDALVDAIETASGRLGVNINGSGEIGGIGTGGGTRVANSAIQTADIPSLPASIIGSGTLALARIPTIPLANVSGTGALAAASQVGNSEFDGADPLAYEKIIYPTQKMDAAADTPIASSFGGTFTELLRVSFANVDENHLINLAGTALRLRSTGSHAADAECTINWKIIANDASGTEANAITLASGALAVVETAPSSGVFQATNDGTGGGTPLPGGPLTNWQFIQDYSATTTQRFYNIISNLWSFPLTHLYVSVWMSADSGATGYIDTASAGNCLLKIGGIGELENP
jgi:hypothetical protein